MGEISSSQIMDQISSLISKPCTSNDVQTAKIFTKMSEIAIIADNLLGVSMWHDKKPDEIVHLYENICKEYNISTQELLEAVKKVSLEQHARTTALVNEIKGNIADVLDKVGGK